MFNSLAAQTGKPRPAEGKGWTQGPQPGKSGPGLPMAPHTPGAVAPLLCSLLRRGVHDCGAWEVRGVQLRESDRFLEVPAWKEVERVPACSVTVQEPRGRLCPERAGLPLAGLTASAEASALAKPP